MPALNIEAPTGTAVYCGTDASGALHVRIGGDGPPREPSLLDWLRAARQFAQHAHPDRGQVVAWQKLELAERRDLNADAGASDGA